MCYRAPLGFLGRTCRRVGFTVSFTVSGILQLLLLKTSSVFCGFDQIQLGDDAPAKLGAGGGKQGTVVRQKMATLHPDWWASWIICYKWESAVLS